MQALLMGTNNSKKTMTTLHKIIFHNNTHLGVYITTNLGRPISETLIRPMSTNEIYSRDGQFFIDRCFSQDEPEYGTWELFDELYPDEKVEASIGKFMTTPSAFGDYKLIHTRLLDLVISFENSFFVATLNLTSDKYDVLK